MTAYVYIRKTNVKELQYIHVHIHVHNTNAWESNSMYVPQVCMYKYPQPSCSFLCIESAITEFPNTPLPTLNY